MLGRVVEAKRPNRRRSVALVGIDGSGKSTQAELLRRALAEGPRGARVFVVHPFGRKLLRVGFTSPVFSEGGPRRGRKWALLQKVVAVLDVSDVAIYLWLVHLWINITAPVCDREVWLIGDRSFDEVLIKHWHRGTFSWRTIERTRRLAPKFETTIWLEVRPGATMLRKSYSDPASSERLYAAYSTAADRFGWRVIPDRRSTPERRHSPAPGRNPERRKTPDRRRYPDLGRPLESVYFAIINELGLIPCGSDGASEDARAPFSREGIS